MPNMIDEVIMPHSSRKGRSSIGTFILWYCVPLILLSCCNGTHESKESDATSGGKLLNTEDVMPPLYTPEQANALSNLAPLPSSGSGDDPDDAEQRRQDSERDYQIHKLENRMDELEREQQRQRD